MKVEVSRVKATEIDLNSKRQENQFIIEEKDGIHFYREEIKIECLAVDSGEGIFSSKPGRITHERSAGKSQFGNLFKLTYQPDARTMPGRYRMTVPFRTGRGKPEVCRVAVDFKVVDTTGLEFFDGNNRPSHLIDLKTENTSSSMPLKLFLKGPRNEEVKLDLCYVGDETGSSCTVRNPQFTGSVSKEKLKLSGANSKDEIHYYRSPSLRSGRVEITARIGKTMKTLKFTVIYSDVDCEVLFSGTRIADGQTLFVPLAHSLLSYPFTMKLSGMFSILGPRLSKVSIRMVWNGESYGHHHDIASTDKLATGKFTGFRQSSDFWIPEKEDAAGRYKEITYLS